MADFRGFSPETTAFLAELTQNNNREWFDRNRDRYETYFLEPARMFIAAVGDALSGPLPDVRAIPKVNGSIFRLNRDTRFSRDKTPFKTHLGIWIWSGDGKRMERPGFYFHAEPGRLMLGSGMYMFPKDRMTPYRDAVIGPKSGKALKKAVDAVSGAGYEIGNVHYKRVPRGYDADHPNAPFLLHNGLTARVDMPLPDEFHSAGLVPFTMDHFLDMMPIVSWLREFVVDR